MNKKYNIIVVGGGISGVAAATAAAREGMKVLLVEKNGCLGGAMSMSLVYPYMGYWIKNGKVLLSDGIFTEMRKRFERYNDSSWEYYKMVFDDMLTQSGVDILLHSSVISVHTENRSIKSVSVATKSGTIDLSADFFADTTGDGELMAMAGCEYQLGRESDNLCQPMTACFRVCGVDIDLFKSEKDALLEKYHNEQKNGTITNPRENILVFYGLGGGIVHFNTTRVVKHNPTDPLEITRAEITARRQIHEMMNFLKKNSEAFRNSCLISVSNHIGVRESRKLKGVHVLTADELKNCIEFEDTIALGRYPIDIHNPEGSGTYIYELPEDEFYRIPYRCLLPKEYDNMLVAGRCISATHEAHSAVRIMPICACMGEAAGTALALAHKTGANAHTLDINLLRTTLKNNGAAV